MSSERYAGVVEKKTSLKERVGWLALGLFVAGYGLQAKSGFLIILGSGISAYGIFKK